MTEPRRVNPYENSGNGAYGRQCLSTGAALSTRLHRPNHLAAMPVR